MSSQQSGKADLPIHNAKLDCIWRTGGYLQLCSFAFLYAQSPFRSSFRRWQLETSCPRHMILAQPPLLQRSNGPNDKHSLEEHLWHVAFATSTDAPLRLARLGWLPRQANLPLLGGWRGTWQMCHWPWNPKSTVRKARSSHAQNQPGSSWENWPLPTTSQIHFFALHNLHVGPIQTMAAGN